VDPFGRIMTIEEDRAAKRQRATVLTNEISTSDVDLLVRASALGNASFEEARQDFSETIMLFRQLVPLMQSVPTAIVEEIGARAEATVGVIDEISKFDLAGQPSPMDVRGGLIRKFASENSKNQKTLIPYVAAAGYQSLDPATVRQSVADALAHAQVSAEQLSKEQAEITRKMEDALHAVQESAGKAGVARQSETFAIEATAHGNESTLWLRWTLVFGAAALAWTVVGFFILHPSDNSKDAGDIAAYLSGRLVVLSILLFGLGYSARQTSAHRHNQIVNRHRQNALTTFEAFVASTDDPETKNAVLLEATRAIFTAQQSGYLKNETDQQNPSTFVEIVRRVQPSS
jgi:hypothetical protein